MTGVEYEFPSEGQLGDDSTRQMFCVVTLTPQREFFRGGDGLDQAASRVEALAPFQVLYKVHEGPPFLLLMHEVEGALWREGDACIVPASVVRRKGIPGGNGDGLAGVVPGRATSGARRSPCTTASRCASPTAPGTS